MSDNFWWTSDGSDTRETATGSYESGGGGYELIPEKTGCLVDITNAAWKGEEGQRKISVEFTIRRPEQLAGRKMWKALWVMDLSPYTLRDKGKGEAITERDKHKAILSNIDKMCGGKLSKNGRVPDDDDLALALVNKPASIRIMVMTPKTGDPFNYISEIKPKGDIEPTVFAKTGGGGSQARRRPDPIDDDFADDGEDIPFATSISIW